MVRTLAVLTLSLLVLPFLGGSVVAEDPSNQDCEGVAVVLLLCAGADAGTNGGCDDNNQAGVSCWYTYGWNLNASSPAALPGGGHLEWSYEVRYCLDGEGCTLVESGDGAFDCTWTVDEVEPCWEQDVGGGDIDFVLSLGQCVQVTAIVNVASTAWSIEEESPLFEASVEDQSEQGGAACYLDDGRP